MGKRKERKFILLKDITIPKGTVLEQAPAVTERNNEHFDCIVGLSRNTCGEFTYCIDDDFRDELMEYFQEI